MTFRRNRALVALATPCALLCALVTPTTTARSQPAGQAPLDTAALERVLLAELRDSRSPGAAIAVVRGDRVVYAKGFGVASVETGEPVTAQTLFRIGSTTKMFTGLTAVLLAGERKLALGEPVGRYGRGLDPALARLTMDQLLSHRGGLINEASGAGRHDDAALGERVRSWGREHVFAPPGDVYSYSGPGYWLAGYVIEQAAGAPYADVVRDRVLRPLGMTRSTFRPLAAMTYPVAQDHRVAGDSVAVIRPFTDDVTTWASGSLFSSAAELARFATALLNGGRLAAQQAIPREAVDAMFTPHSSTPSAECGYSYGLSVCERAGVRTLSHYGFRVGSGSVVTLAPAQKVAVIILANRNGGIFARTEAKALELLLPRVRDAAAVAPRDSAAGSARRTPRTPSGWPRRFLGTYVSGPDTLRITTRPSGVVYRYGGEEYATRPGGADGFVVLDPEGNEVQRFVLVTGATTGRAYLHDGLNAFRRVRK